MMLMFAPLATFAQKFRHVRNNPASRGIIICGSAHGVSIQANRFKGIRAICGYTPELVRLGRLHNDANVLCLPARVLDREYNIPLWRDIIDAFMNTPFAGAERYIRRNRELDQLD